MSDRFDGRFGLRGLAALLAGALLLGCQPDREIEPPPVPPVPCTREVAVASSTVVVAAGACNPGCIHVPVGTEVLFQNLDPAYYLFASPPPPADALELVPVPARAGMTTLPLATAGTHVYEALQWPAATVTIFVE